MCVCSLTFENLFYPTEKNEIMRPLLHTATLHYLNGWRMGELVKLAFNIWNGVKRNTLHTFVDKMMIIIIINTKLSFFHLVAISSISLWLDGHHEWRLCVSFWYCCHHHCCR